MALLCVDGNFSPRECASPSEELEGITNTQRKLREDLELKVDLRNTRDRLREQVIRDPTLYFVGLLRARTTVTAVLVSRVAFLHTGTEAAQHLQHDTRLRCDTRQQQSNAHQSLHLTNRVKRPLLATSIGGHG